MKNLTTFLFSSFGILFVAVLVTFWISSAAPQKEPWVDARLRPAVLEWQRDLDREGVQWRRGWSRVDSVVVRRVEDRFGRWEKSKRTVVISPVAIERGAETLRATVYHELGHAVFHLGHHGEGLMQGCGHRNERYAEKWNEMVEEYISFCKWNQLSAY
jgi:hypothetical protein